MFSDPLSINVEGSVRSFARVSTGDGVSLYRTADGVYTLTIIQNEVLAEVTLYKNPVDADPFNGGPVDDLIVGVGQRFVRNRARYNQSAMNPLRADLNTFLTDSYATRLIGGEL